MRDLLSNAALVVEADLRARVRLGWEPRVSILSQLRGLVLNQGRQNYFFELRKFKFVDFPELSKMRN